MADPDYLDSAPTSDEVTPYDERHLVTYLRLLDADAEGADWKEAATIIFGLDVTAHPERAQRLYDSHIARARWMSRHGYRQLAARGHLKPTMK
jgi:hypothetical protein